ncbi:MULTISPECIES: hypothetical protein [unclassified Bradyrhizobium]|uniref:hypothetical protein n=1 Tax=unclassified Bradyrhizobium TaxID=2631580 RepID=UPI001FFB3F94|nr:MULTISPECIES: hypothetical protein [unclassified Bradyrhizobium]MCK1608158.1 hypothetical protein [Bradyrhizobium sp. 163]MCK1767191.1 hypothetical protein [Bradyrhizobium sp. 136]
MKRSILGLVVLLMLPLTGSRASDVVTVWVEPSQSVDVYWEVNLSGKVYVAADIDGRPACLEYWWIRWPTTSIKSLGRRCGATSFSVPGLADLAVGGKLRAGSAEAKTRIRGTASERVAHDLFRGEF